MEKDELSSGLEKEVEDSIADVPDFVIENSKDDDNYSLKVIDKDDFKEISWVDFVQW